jgi:hypothetical protein
MEEEKNSEEEFWSEGAFTETVDPSELKEKMKTFHMKHDEDVNYDCKRCSDKISAHNRDWHGGMCDDCFNSKYFPDNQKRNFLKSQNQKPKYLYMTYSKSISS